MINKNIIFLSFVFLSVSAIGLVCNQRTIKQKESRKGSLTPMVKFLQEYIQINTSQPKPDYEKALTFLKKQAQACGFLYKQVGLPSGNKVLVITYKGTDPSLSSIALNHHIDVVPATPEGWKVDPFSGAIVDDSMIGRGTQDMKGIGATHYFALKELKDLGIKPKRTIHIFAVPEEEVGGYKGTKEFVETSYFKSLNVGFVVDEGHASGDASVLDLKVTERKPMQIQVTVKGDLAHGSHLECRNAIHDLVTFLYEILELHNKSKRTIGKKEPGELLSCNMTSLSAGIKKEDGFIALNVVPNTAQATIDVRIPQTIKKKEIVALLDKTIAQFPTMSYEILAQANEEPEPRDYHTPLYKALEKAIKTTGLKAQPHFFEASSDLRFYQARGIDGVGLTPFAIVDNIHGINESVPLKELERGKEIMVQFLKDFAF